MKSALKEIAYIELRSQLRLACESICQDIAHAENIQITAGKLPEIHLTRYLGQEPHLQYISYRQEEMMWYTRIYKNHQPLTDGNYFLPTGISFQIQSVKQKPAVYLLTITANSLHIKKPLVLETAVQKLSAGDALVTQ